MKDYTFISDIPKSKHIGGVGIFIRSDLDLSLLDKYNLDNLNKNTVENLWLSIKKVTKNSLWEDCIDILTVILMNSVLLWKKL